MPMEFANLCLTIFFFFQVTLGSVWSLGVIYAVVTDQIIGREPDLPCQVPLDFFTRICHGRYLLISLPGSTMPGTSRSLYRGSAMLDPLNLFTRIFHGRCL
jgi:hypothetical protein